MRATVLADHPQIMSRIDSNPPVLFVGRSTLGEIVKAELEHHVYRVVLVSDEEQLIAATIHSWSLVFIDSQWRGDFYPDGVALCQTLRREQPSMSCVLITTHEDSELVEAARRSGACEVLSEPVTATHLLKCIERARQSQHVESRARARGTSPPMLTVTPEIRQIMEIVDRIADRDVTVLICGESGTGKELIARALHERSRRAKGPYIAINCGAMPGPLLESELFGHVKGAFTDAHQPRTGLFVQADGGTLLLDEVGEMSLEMQVKLLRVLQERKVRPVGGEAEREFSTRVVAATNRDLLAAVAAGSFRSDLYYRLNVVQLEVPPLRARQADVMSLSQHFLERCAQRSGIPVLRLSQSAAECLMEYDWPGNIRELENTIEHAVALAQGPEISVDDLPPALRGAHVGPTTMDETQGFATLEEITRRYVRRVLDACNGNKSRAARVLGIDRRSLYRRLDS